MPLDEKLIKFSTLTERLITYNYIDVADGTGNQNFFANSSLYSGGTINFLSESVEDTLLTIITAPADIDLTPFNSPRDVRGTALILANMDVQSGIENFTFTVKKWDGTTETSIGSVTSHEINENVGFVQSFLPIDLTTTHFNTGDVLRLTVTSNGANNEVSIDTTNPFRLTVPFELI